MELPVDIMLDILTPLPTVSVLESKLVSKTWRDVVRHPSFSQKHSNRLLSAADDSGNLGFLFTDYIICDSKKVYYVEYSENNDPPITSTRRINLPPKFIAYTFVGSCNGLICLCNLGSFIICNPITKEYCVLSEFTYCLYYGFGYLASTNEYKVVRINEPKRNSIEVEVYTLGSGNGWRNVGKLNSRFYSSKIGVLANGALHWIDSEKQMMMSFDLVDEKFREISLPTLPQLANRNISLKPIGVLGDSLMCVNTMRKGSDDRFLDIWLLKENGDMNWEVDYKSISCSEEHISDMKPFAMTNSGAVLCFRGRSRITSVHRYDLKSSSLEMLVSLDNEFDRSPFPHMKTLVSLKALGEENTKRMKSSLGKKRNSFRRRKYKKNGVKFGDKKKRLADKHQVKGRIHKHI